MSRLHAAVAENLNVFRNWVANNKGSYVSPNLIIALVNGRRYIYIAANLIPQIRGRYFAGVEFLDDSAKPYFRQAILNRVLPAE